MRGDLGTSFISGRPVSSDLAQYLPASLELALTSMPLALLAGIPLGVLAAVRRDGPVDYLARLVSLLGASVPAFWLGLVLLFFLYYQLQLLPGPGRIDPWLLEPKRVSGLILVDAALAGDWAVFWSGLRHLLLPALVLAGYPTAMIARLTRASMLEVLSAEYVRTAHAKGLRARTVLFTHALRNALIPTITTAGLAFGSVLAGAVTVETVFSWPGIGRYAVVASTTLDYPAILGCTLAIAVIFVAVNLVVDVLYAVVDPRIRAS
jgi:peptide/nickel transport system permease protein